MILIFHAFSLELAPFRRRLKECQPLAAQGLRGFSGRLGPTPIHAVATGIGITRARTAARIALGVLPRPRRVIVCGVAGALAPELRVGDVVLASRVLLAETAQPAGTPREIILGQSRTALELMRGAGLAPIHAALLSVPAVLATAAAKHEWHARTQAAAVDMESGAVAEECLAQNLPTVVVRTISDDAADNLPAIRMMDGAGTVRVFEAMRQIVRRPALAIALVRLARNFMRARAELSRALAALAAEADTAI